MKLYYVKVPVSGWRVYTVEAENEDEAIRIAETMRYEFVDIEMKEMSFEYSVEEAVEPLKE